MVQSKTLSLAGGIFMFFAAMHELVSMLLGIASAENVDKGQAVWWVGLQMVVALAFTGRILAVWKIERIAYAVVGVSYVICFWLSWFYFTSVFRLEPGVVYSLFDGGLASWMIGFFVLSFIRFFVTSLVAANSVISDEFGSYS